MSYAHALVATLQDRLGHLVRELAKFGIVGAIAFVVDVGTFNALRSGDGPLNDRPLTAKIISTVLATTVAFAGNRQWTFRHRERAGLRKEYVLFFALNAFALGLALTCLGVSHYLLNFTSPLADNIAANGVGMVLGTVFRFWTYRKFVFTAPVESTEPAAAPLAA